mmetsp:Transcript_21393/g.34248  ORF Transcript_21393/g.34248 Transcript_21393/m.34248 type:complete len:184 (-) Transcript_21393:61-612(-)
MAEAASSKPNREAFQAIVGKWTGECTVKYPTMKNDLKYGEEISIVDTKRPFLNYSSSTWRADNKQPLHVENGFIRFPAQHGVDFVISQCTGITEISSGEIAIEKMEEQKDDGSSQAQKKKFTVTVVSKNIGRVSSAKEPHVTEIKRVYEYSYADDTLSYDIRMSTTTTKDLTQHLIGSFKRVQ